MECSLAILAPANDEFIKFHNADYGLNILFEQPVPSCVYENFQHQQKLPQSAFHSDTSTDHDSAKHDQFHYHDRGNYLGAESYDGLGWSTWNKLLMASAPFKTPRVSKYVLNHALDAKTFTLLCVFVPRPQSPKV